MVLLRQPLQGIVAVLRVGLIEIISILESSQTDIILIEKIIQGGVLDLC